MPASLAELDRRLSHRMSEPLAAPGRARLAAAVARISQTGSYGVGWIILFAIVAATSATWAEAVVGAGCVVSTLLINTGIKQVVRRPRPVSRVGVHPSSWSFPSAHTSMAVVGAALMSSLIPGLAVLWWSVTVVLGLSRIMLGVHYLGDVVAGAVLGGLLAWPALLLLAAAGS